MNWKAAGCGVVAMAVLALAPAMAQEIKPVHGIAMHGEPKYPADFTHTDYVNPDAPKGGLVTVGAGGTFDSFNGFILKGVPASGVSLIYDTLLSGSSDEAFSQYGNLAKSIRMPKDRSWIEFTLRDEAKWHDGKPVTPEDVVWTFNTFIEKGQPFFRAYYADVTNVEKTGERSVKFTFNGTTNRELPLIVGQLQILPKHYWEGRDFAKTTLEPPLGSGAYKIGKFEPGRYITYDRVADYWGDDVPINKGTQNFGQIRFEYYRDTAVQLEAFKAGKIDYRGENSSRQWATGYDFKAVKDGRVIKKMFPHERPSGMQGFAFNTRREIFKDRRVRQALGYAFDFEWSNKTLFYGQYSRTNSFFDNSELAAKGLPTGEELNILEKYRGKVPPEVFTTEFKSPVTDGSGNIRRQLRAALKLLKEAGWTVKDGALRNAAGDPFEFEFLIRTGGLMDKIILPFTKNLERLGIKATIRSVDVPQYIKRYETFDFDVVVAGMGQSDSPGNEQRDYWHSKNADVPGSRNIMGIKDPVVDELIDGIIQAPDREALVANTRALDRVLLWSYYVIPQFHNRGDRYAYWNKFGMPTTIPKNGVSIMGTWWIDQEKAAVLKQGQ